ncbi:CMRF35-like molecule 8 isoform X1 [Acipenser ruthenus]|uniref:CMRF35-like molecule 8 isoform X1 n=2 Tax=Acipenser ruthenus TaxID=7906 RepID=UPI00145ABE1A|nr:CMRF35-like molecule 8 isoform X1 [Acipenser ruthenus]
MQIFNLNRTMIGRWAFLLFLLILDSYCVTGQKPFTLKEGESVTIFYPLDRLFYNQVMFCCKVINPAGDCANIAISHGFVHEAYRGRVSITQHLGRMYVTIHNFNRQDAGIYRCGVNENVYFSVALSLLPAPTQAKLTSPKTTTTSSSSIADHPTSDSKTQSADFPSTVEMKWIIPLSAVLGLLAIVLISTAFIIVIFKKQKQKTVPRSSEDIPPVCNQPSVPITYSSIAFHSGPPEDPSMLYANLRGVDHPEFHSGSVPVSAETVEYSTVAIKFK